jgi:CheY-like chemotaxis protein
MKSDLRAQLRGGRSSWSEAHRLFEPRPLIEKSGVGVVAKPSYSGGLYGLRVLLVEDEAATAMMIEDMLAELGCIVVDVASTVGQALEQVQAGAAIDAAILDVNIDGEKVYPVADALLEREVPFVFSTGYDSADIVERYPHSQIIAKPYQPETLAGVLAGCCHLAPRLRHS